MPVKMVWIPDDLTSDEWLMTDYQMHCENIHHLEGKKIGPGKRGKTLLKGLAIEFGSRKVKEHFETKIIHILYDIKKICSVNWVVNKSSCTLCVQYRKHVRIVSVSMIM